MNGAYESFRVAGQNKADIDSYIALVKPKVYKLIKEQVKGKSTAICKGADAYVDNVEKARGSSVATR